MHKKSSKLTSPILSIFFIGVLLFTSTIFSSFNTASQVFAQPMSSYEFENNNSYDDYDNNYVPSSYSEYPTEENKYECQKGPLEGFFVSSVEFCKFKFDDSRKDNRDNKTGPQGPPGPQGPQGLPGINGTNGVNGTNGINGTNATGFTCVICLLDALAKLETGAVVVNVSASLPGTIFNPPVRGLVNLGLPLTIDLDTATLLQAQLGSSLLGDDNATIFEICAAIDAGTTLDINAVLAALELTIDPLIRAEITAQITNIGQVLNATGVIVPAPLLTAILTGIDFTAVVDEIIIDIRASLEILEACLGSPPTPPPPPPTTETLTVIKNTDCQADPATCEQNPIQPSNFTVVIDGNNPSQNNFPGSSTGTNVELEPGAYNVTEQGLDPVTPAICSTLGFEAGRNVSSGISGNLFICTNFSEECEGDITIGNPQTCTIENVLVEQNFLDLVVTNTRSNDVSILLGNGTGSFGTATNFAVGTFPFDVAVGDFNGDTFLDLAVVNTNSNNVSILLGTGTGSFGPATNFATGGTAPRYVAVGDFNGDGILDLAVTNAGSTSNVSILLGTGTGSFGPATSFATGGTFPTSVAVGDFNGDGILDLAVTNTNSNTVAILLGTGTGSFGPATIFAVGATPASVAVGDFNGDGILDLAVANFGSTTVSILLGTGTGSFGPATNFAVGSAPFSVAVGDFNGDGILDLAVVNQNSNNVSILLGTGTGSFGPATNFAVGITPRSVAVGDFNDDGILDLAVVNGGSINVPGSVSILLGTGTGSFGPATNFAVGSFPRAVAVGDFN